MNRYKTLFAFLFLLSICACAHTGKTYKLTTLPAQGPVELALHPSVGLSDVTQYHSRTLTKTFSSGEITKKSQEDVDFAVETKVIHVDQKNGKAKYEVTTLNKEGKADLSDFAMPEPGEKIEFTLSKKAQVIKAGDFPEGTLYFVPPVSLPEEGVQVGDSWPMTAEWMSLKSGIPLKLQLVSILKGMRDCGVIGPCAEIEVSGDIEIIGARTSTIASKLNAESLKMRFRSEFSGRILFSMNQGMVVFSYLKSSERLSGEKDSVDINSCMLSYVTKPNAFPISVEPNCHPSEDLPIF